jgi:hypothetical protein
MLGVLPQSGTRKTARQPEYVFVLGREQVFQALHEVLGGSG